MKWWEFSEDLGDGTSRALRYRTKEAADAAREKKEEEPYWISDGDGSPVTEVDTDSKYFFQD